MSPPAYENRLILYIDFLAFKEHVDRTVTEPAFLGRVVEALQELREIGMEKEIFRSQQMTHFSDSVVLSYKIEETSAVFWLLTQIGLAIISMAGIGFLVRGAVTVGPLFHTDEVLLGPAMVEAYYLESKVARYPRVIADPKVFDVARTHRSRQHEADEEEAYVRKGLAEDDDGQLWIDYVSWMAVVSAGCAPESYPEYLENLGRLIRSGLEHGDSRVLEKHLWLHGKYKKSVEKFRAAPTQRDYEPEQQRRYVAGLPLFEELVVAAKQKLSLSKKQ